MDILTAVIPLGLGVAVSTTSYMIHKVIEVDKKLAEHVASDKEIFDGFREDFAEVKLNQRDQTQKLDRLVEHMLPKR